MWRAFPGFADAKTLGDGFLGPSMAGARHVVGPRSRTPFGRLASSCPAGLHTGEIGLTASDVSGVAVYIAARAAAQAAASETVVSSTVRDLFPGSGLRFGNRRVRR